MPKPERYPAYVEIIDAKENHVKATHGRLNVCSTPYGWSDAVGMCNGNIHKGCRCQKMAYYFDVPNTEVDLNVFALPETPQEVWLSSTSELDTQKVSLCMLDEDWKQYKEIVTLQGTTPVKVTKPIIRINTMIITEGVQAIGTIYLKNGSGTIYRQIDTTNTRGFSSLFSIPAGKFGHLVRWCISFQPMERNKITIAYVTLRAKTSNCNETTTAYVTKDGVIGSEGMVNREFTYPFKVNEKCDIKMSARKMYGNGKIMVAASYEILTLDEATELP